MTELDDYGFERDHSIPRDVYEDYKQEYQKILRHRESRWSKTKLTDEKRLVKSKRLKSFCRKGIPRKHRIQVWMHLSEAQYEMDNNRNLFKELLSREVSHKFKSVIDVDLRRTFPENHYFKESDTQESMIRNLANVLYAFANKNPEIGYCQGLNFVAATLLLAFDEDEKDIIKEEKTFWLLNQLVEKILPEYYGNNMLDLSRDCMVLEELLEDRMSDISKLLRQSQIEMTMIAPKWFICCFADVVPIETVFRIFDCLFYEGDKILFRAALTLIKTHKDELLERRDLPSVMRKFKEIGKDKETLYCHEFIKNMFSMNKGLKRKDIERHRNKTRELLTYSRSLKIETLGRYSSLDRDISSS